MFPHPRPSLKGQEPQTAGSYRGHEGGLLTSLLSLLSNRIQGHQRHQLSDDYSLC